MSLKRLAMRQSVDRLVHHCNNFHVYEAQEVIQRDKLIANIPNLDNSSFTRIVGCFDKLGFKNRLFWNAVAKQFLQRIETMEYSSTISSVLKVISQRCPESIRVEEVQKLILELAESDKLNLAHLSVIPFLASKVPDDLAFWARFEMPILLVLSTKLGTGSYREAAFNFSTWYLSEIKVGSPHYWHSVQALILPHLPGINSQNFSRITYSVIKTHFLQPAFKQAFLDNLLEKFLEPNSNTQDQSMFIYALTILEGHEKNKLMAQVIHTVVTLYRRDNITPVRQCVELLDMYLLDEAARTAMLKCFVDFFNAVSWKMLEQFPPNVHMMALSQDNLDSLKRDLILERLDKDDLDKVVIQSVVHSPYTYRWLATCCKTGVLQWHAGMQRVFFMQFEAMNSNNWGLNSAMQLVAGFELALEVDAEPSFFQELAEYLLDFCRSSKVEIDFMRGITNESLVHWNTDHVRQLIAVVNGHLPLHCYLGHLQRRYQCYNYLRTLDEILSMLLVVHFRHGRRTGLLLEVLKEIIFKYKPTHRLEFYYLTDPDNPALVDLNLPAGKKDHLPSILEALYGQPDLREYEEIKYANTTFEVKAKLPKEEPAAKGLQSEQSMKSPTLPQDFIESGAHRMHFNSLNSLFSLNDNEDLENDEVEFTFSAKDSLGENIVHIEANIEEIKSGLLKDCQSDILSPSPQISPAPKDRPAVSSEKPSQKKEKKSPETHGKAAKQKQEPNQLFVSAAKPVSHSEQEAKHSSKASKKAADSTEGSKGILFASKPSNSPKEEDETPAPRDKSASNSPRKPSSKSASKN